MLLMLGVVWTEPGGDERMEGWWEARSTRPMTMGGRSTGLARRSGVDWLGSGWQTGRQTGRRVEGQERITGPADRTKQRRQFGSKRRRGERH